jgi:lysozyme
MAFADELERQLTRDEGVRRVVYADRGGVPTIGIGHNLRARPLSDRAIRAIFEDDVAATAGELFARLPWVAALSEPRRGAFLNLAFNLGVGGLLGFPRLLVAAQGGRWDDAARELLDSAYARQVGERAVRLAQQLAEDRWV